MLPVEKNKIYLIVTVLAILQQAVGVSFDSLYDRELKSSYGFEILKYYHNDKFGNEDVKKFKG